jgi:hypothetical protein
MMTSLAFLVFVRALSRREALVRPTAPAPATSPVVSTPQRPVVIAPPTAPLSADPAKARSPRSASSTNRPPRPKRSGGSWPKLDILGAAALGLVAVAAAVTLPPGPLRLTLVLPMLLFVPGYLLLQAFVVPAATGDRRCWQALASLGISPAVLGLLSLLTSVVEGGFRLGAILALTAFGSLAFAAAALVRRRALSRSNSSPQTTDAPQAASAKSGPARP